MESKQIESGDQPERLVQLDGLRAIAFFAVAFSHWAPKEFQLGLPWGMGVQLFFVLSGFLITGILLDYREAAAKQLTSPSRALQVFYLRRSLRIFPLFYLVIAVSLLLKVSSISETWKWHATYCSNFYYYFSGNHDSFVHFWSLAVEEQFYLLWPLMIFFAPPRLIPWLIALMIVSAPIFRIVAENPGHRVNYVLISCLDSLGVGALLACCRRSGQDLLLKRYVGPGLIGMVAIFWSLWTKWPENSWIVDLGHTMVVFLFGWIVYRSATGIPTAVGRALEWKWMTYLGRISYGLYIIHPFFNRLNLVPIFRFAGLPETWASNVAVRLLFQLACTILLAAISWHFFEKPINALKRKVRLVPPPKDDPTQEMLVKV
jgi:peptidoglycan/LPS O-acetylase OafA/YrhL